MKTLDSGSIVAAAGDQVFVTLAEEVVILSLADGVYYGLDAIGAAVWGLLQEPVTVAEICKRIIRSYDVGAERCGRDVLELVRALAERGLVEVEDARAA